jgi:transcription elongation GreA/GreB family factor
MQVPSITILDDVDDAEELEIEVGDLVTYSPAEKPNEALKIRITAHKTDIAQGFVAQHTPLAQTLIGATAGETVVLRVPAMPTQALIIHQVKRDRIGAAV